MTAPWINIGSLVMVALWFIVHHGLWLLHGSLLGHVYLHHGTMFIKVFHMDLGWIMDLVNIMDHCLIIDYDCIMDHCWIMNHHLIMVASRIILDHSLIIGRGGIIGHICNNAHPRVMVGSRIKLASLYHYFIVWIIGRPTRGFEAVWPEKNRQVSIKIAQKWIH